MKILFYAVTAIILIIIAYLVVLELYIRHNESAMFLPASINLSNNDLKGKYPIQKSSIGKMKTMDFDANELKNYYGDYIQLYPDGTCEVLLHHHFVPTGPALYYSDGERLLPMKGEWTIEKMKGFPSPTESVIKINFSFITFKNENDTRYLGFNLFVGKIKDRYFIWDYAGEPRYRIYIIFEPTDIQEIQQPITGNSGRVNELHLKG